MALVEEQVIAFSHCLEQPSDGSTQDISAQDAAFRLGSLKKAPWRLQGARMDAPQLRAGAWAADAERPWRKRPVSNSSASTQMPSTAGSLGFSPAASMQGSMMLAPLLQTEVPTVAPLSTWDLPQPGERVGQSWNCQLEPAFLSTKAPPGCLNPIVTRKVGASFAKGSQMPWLPRSARKLGPVTQPGAAGSMPLSARGVAGEAKRDPLGEAGWGPLGDRSAQWRNLSDMWDAYSAEQSSVAGDSKPSTAPAGGRMLAPLQSSTEEATNHNISQTIGSDFSFDGDGEDSPSSLTKTIKRLQQVNGVWDPTVWVEARSEILQRNTTEGLATLLKCVRVTTEWALQRRTYRTQPKVRHCTGHVDLNLPFVRQAHWCGLGNLEVPPEMQESQINGKLIPPPLMFTEMEPLDVITQLRKIHGNNRPITLVTEIDAFDDAGEIVLWRQKGGINPCCLPYRSDFSLYAAEAKTALKGSNTTIQQHISANQDPYIFLCPSVTVFRGPREEGYPFLQEPINLHVIAASIPRGRPPVQTVFSREGPTSWFAYKNDHNSLIERFNLLGLAAYQASDDGVLLPPRRREEDKPILVLTALGCRGSSPRDALAGILKNWRRRFAPFFHSVYICLPKALNLASFLDQAVNKSIYRILVLEAQSADLLASKCAPWHWERKEIKMSCQNETMEQVATFCRKAAVRASRLQGPSHSHGMAPHFNITVSEDMNMTSKASMGFEGQGSLRKEQSFNMMAALKSIEAGEHDSRRPSKAGQRPPSAIPEDEHDSDDDYDMAPPDVTNLGSTVSYAQPVYCSEDRQASGRQSADSDRPSSQKSNVTTMTTTLSVKEQQRDHRQSCMKSTQELLGHKSSSATVAGVVLAGGIRNLLGFEKTNSLQSSNSLKITLPSNADQDALADQDASSQQPMSPVRKSMQRKISKQIKEDEQKAKAQEVISEVEAEAEDEDMGAQVGSCAGLNEDPDTMAKAHGALETTLLDDETPQMTKASEPQETDVVCQSVASNDVDEAKKQPQSTDDHLQHPASCSPDSETSQPQRRGRLASKASQGSALTDAESDPRCKSGPRLDDVVSDDEQERTSLDRDRKSDDRTSDAAKKRPAKADEDDPSVERGRISDDGSPSRKSVSSLRSRSSTRSARRSVLNGLTDSGPRGSVVAINQLPELVVEIAPTKKDEEEETSPADAHPKVRRKSVGDMLDMARRGSFKQMSYDTFHKCQKGKPKPVDMELHGNEHVPSASEEKKRNKGLDANMDVGTESSIDVGREAPNKSARRGSAMAARDGAGTADHEAVRGDFRKELMKRKTSSENLGAPVSNGAATGSQRRMSAGAAGRRLSTGRYLSSPATVPANEPEPVAATAEDRKALASEVAAMASVFERRRSQGPSSQALSPAAPADSRPRSAVGPSMKS